jgi:hypothetical protein
MRTNRRLPLYVEGLEERNLLSLAHSHGLGPAALVQIEKKTPPPKPIPPINGSINGSYQMIAAAVAAVSGPGTAGAYGSVVAAGTIQAASIAPGQNASGHVTLLLPGGGRLFDLNFSGKIPKNINKPITVNVVAVNTSGVPGLPASFPGTGTVVIGPTSVTATWTFQFRFTLKPGMR